MEWVQSLLDAASETGVAGALPALGWGALFVMLWLGKRTWTALRRPKTLPAPTPVDHLYARLMDRLAAPQDWARTGNPDTLVGIRRANGDDSETRIVPNTTAVIGALDLSEHLSKRQLKDVFARANEVIAYIDGEARREAVLKALARTSPGGVQRLEAHCLVTMDRDDLPLTAAQEFLGKVVTR